MLQLKTVSENKGRGFFATCNIEAGTLILSEKPMIERNILKQELDIFQIEQNFENETDQEIEKEKLEIRTICREYLNLQKSDLTEYSDLCYHPFDIGKETVIHMIAKEFEHLMTVDDIVKVYGIYKTNAFNNGLYPDLGWQNLFFISNFELIFINISAKFNHSCCPNAEVFWNEETKSRDIVAVTDIVPGDEICHNYLHDIFDHGERQKEIVKRWNFKCCCYFCTNKLDLSLMRNLHQCHKICYQNLPLNEVLVKFNDPLNIKELRLHKTVQILDKLYTNKLAFYLVLFKASFNVYEQLSIIGLQLSSIIYNCDHPTVTMWSYRVRHKYLGIIQVLFSNFSNFCCILVTITVLIYNFYENNILQFTLLMFVFIIFLRT